LKIHHSTDYNETSYQSAIVTCKCSSIRASFIILYHFTTFDIEEYRDLEIKIRESLTMRTYARFVHCWSLQLSFCRRYGSILIQFFTPSSGESYIVRDGALRLFIQGHRTESPYMAVPSLPL